MPSQVRDRIIALSRFQGGPFLTTSFFLDTDKSKRNRKEIFLAVKHLLAGGRTDVAALDAARDKKASLEKDLEAIEAYCAGNMASEAPGLAIYSCAGAGFWEALDLPEAPSDRIVFDRNPYIRPINRILEARRRFLVLTLDRREARWYEVFMNRIGPLASLSSDIPKKVKSGMEGQETKRVERHVDALVHGHLKRSAQTTFDILKKNGFAGLWLGCPDVISKDLESLLHPTVREKIKGRLKAKPSDPLEKVLREAEELERRLKDQEEEALLKKLIGEIEKGDRARSGLRDCLAALNKGEVQTLVVTRLHSVPGKSCPRCKLLFVDEPRCPACERKTESRPDIVDEAIEAAVQRHCDVKYVTSPSRLDHYGKIGAFLRYKAPF
ncbi:MAG: baeRF10 domain-containing protein [Candidatus Aminicenantales bacterium]